MISGASEDFYSKWSVRIGADNAITIKHTGTSATHTAEGWINLAKGAFPESEHIKEVVNAIHWHFGPADAKKVMDRYLVQINKQHKEKAEG